MEVCGTHTMAISSSGIRRAVDDRLRLLSGPGCPVCVTAQEEIDACVSLARREGVKVVTFGDMLRVPGSGGSLETARAAGADVRVVYSPLDAVRMAKAEPGEFVFLGVGFETTIPTVAAALVSAKEAGLRNFTVLTMFKLIPPALDYIAANEGSRIDGFILPGHVSTIIGSEPYRFLVERYRMPSCVAGFEALDVLQAILSLLEQLQSGPEVAVQYRRSVRVEGNQVARQLMAQVFEPCAASWRGIGTIPDSGLRLRAEFAEFDAWQRFDVRPVRPKKSSCRCGEVMLGRLLPTDCGLFARRCTPERPFGPCMVSSEGACAAYYKYERN